jgi:hypothetical protein
MVKSVFAKKDVVGPTLRILGSFPFWILSWFCFIMVLRTAERRDFGFYWSVMIPSVGFYLVFGLMIFGAINSVRKSFASPNFRPLSGLRAFLPYRICNSFMMVSFALAYSCLAGIVVGAGDFALTGYERWAFPRPQFRHKKEIRTV